MSKIKGNFPDTRIATLARDQKLAAAVQNLFGGQASITLVNQTMTPQQVQQVVLDRIATGNAIETTRAAYMAAVHADREKLFGHGQTHGGTDPTDSCLLRRLTRRSWRMRDLGAKAAKHDRRDVGSRRAAGRCHKEAEVSQRPEGCREVPFVGQAAGVTALQGFAQRPTLAHSQHSCQRHRRYCSLTAKRARSRSGSSEPTADLTSGSPPPPRCRATTMRAATPKSPEMSKPARARAMSTAYSQRSSEYGVAMTSSSATSSCRRFCARGASDATSSCANRAAAGGVPALSPVAENPARTARTNVSHALPGRGSRPEGSTIASLRAQSQARSARLRCSLARGDAKITAGGCVRAGMTPPGTSERMKRAVLLRFNSRVAEAKSLAMSAVPVEQHTVDARHAVAREVATVHVAQGFPQHAADFGEGLKLEREKHLGGSVGRWIGDARERRRNGR